MGIQSKETPIKILLIEDQPSDVRLLREMLVEVKGTSFDFNLAQNLSEGLEQLETQDVDIILLDLSLPDSAGIHTFEQVHTKAPQVPVIILSGITDETVAVNTVRAGAQDYLIKGKTDSELLARAIK